MVFMQLGFVGAFFFALYEQAWLPLFVSVIALLVVWTPSILARSFQMYVPLEFEFILNIFIYGALFLGEIQGFYTKFWWWDLVLHAGSGVALGFIGFIILLSLYRSKKLTVSPALLALFSFCFAFSLGALWEVFEFSMDTLLGFNMQKSGLIDTMWDLIVDAGGALFASVSGYVYLHSRGKKVGVFGRYIKAYTVKNKQHHLGA